MLWYTGSSTEGLPFIHDSFPVNPKAVHHRPKRSRHPAPPPPAPPPPPSQSHTDNGSSTARTSQPKDLVSRDVVLDPQSFKLPAVVESGGISSNGPLRSRSLERGEKGKEPSSFTSYMHRYKACARLKGFSPSRAYCSTRTRSSSTDYDLDFSSILLSPRDPHTTSTTTAPTDPPVDPSKSDPAKADPVLASTDTTASSAELPHLASPQDGTTTVVNGTQQVSELEKRIEEKLKRSGSLDDGMVNGSQHRGRKTRGKGRRSGGGSGGCGVVGWVLGGGRPLGDIVSPRRLQQLLREKDDRTLPHTYYRVSLDGREPDLRTLDMESPR